MRAAISSASAGWQEDGFGDETARILIEDWLGYLLFLPETKRQSLTRTSYDLQGKIDNGRHVKQKHEVASDTRGTIFTVAAQSEQPDKKNTFNPESNTNTRKEKHPLPPAK